MEPAARHIRHLEAALVDQPALAVPSGPVRPARVTVRNLERNRARFSQRFEREARAIAALNHPHICTLYDVGPDYLVMEYVEGSELKGPLPLAETLQYAIEIAGALEAAHAKEITHRDLKPGQFSLTQMRRHASHCPKKNKPASAVVRETKSSSPKAHPPKQQATVARKGSKKALVVALLRRAQGATVAEIAQASGWQHHSVRGFLSGSLGKKMGLTVASAANEAGERTYRIQ